MIDAAFRLLAELDSFKKIALFLLTGLTALSIWLGYRAIDNLAIYQSWNSVPHIIRTTLPCNLVQIRSDYFLISISFPKPANLPRSITTFTSSFWSTTLPDDNDFGQLCQSLVKAINSNEAESILAPYLPKP